MLLERTMVQFLCTYLTRGALQSCFLQKSFDSHASVSLHGIAKNFRLNLRTTRDDIHIISVVLPYYGVLQLRFFENSSGSHNLASIAWNNTKLNIRCTYYMVLHSHSLGTNSSIGGAVMPL